MEWEEERIPLYRQWVFRAVILPVAICVVANAAAAAVLVKRPHTVRLPLPACYLARTRRPSLQCFQVDCGHTWW